ncbi:RNA-binding S4 domain-containing protein [Metamycoplasma auris]|uniref:Ribosome-associated protein YbcJ (S4-like RNA binding protein) n=1 Tax=Metamycoplasma auris TaxID=51363 RepID=A0A2W7G4B0_9BACT|nr:RNA-binding S4 domain-containing protein [Metamycoplasma auris]PZW01510.1 ribosome-associated protein YbcJ (S4-like RNA binding protein) [Metamycoplasma auris]
MKIEIYGEEIKLSQFLKKTSLCRTGGLTKYFLKVHKVRINDKDALGRNSKIRVGDVVWIDDQVYIIKKAADDSEIK